MYVVDGYFFLLYKKKRQLRRLSHHLENWAYATFLLDSTVCMLRSNNAISMHHHYNNELDTRLRWGVLVQEFVK